MSNCTIEGCDNKHNAKGYCSKHYSKILRIPEYHSWRGIIERCHSPNCKSYPRYGGRGITVCDRWQGKNGFSNFITDVGYKPSPKHSIDRIDNAKGYEQSNCRWATIHEQIKNRRRKQKHVGVCFTNQYKVWMATMKIDGKVVLRKTFKTEQEAIKAREAAEVIHLGHKLI